MSKRILFLCANRSVRSLMAASILLNRTREIWDSWITPVQDTSASDVEMVRRVLAEMSVPLLDAPQTTEPLFGLAWDEGIILCSGLADT